MKTARSIDFLIWKYLVPEIRPEVFKSRLISLIAILYISFFNLPRKFFLHYLNGNGQTLTVDTKSILTGNSEVYDRLLSEINSAKKEKRTEGDFYIGQIHVNNPNYKYSIGSFYVTYSLNENSVNIWVVSDYRFTQNNSRITKYLHNWMISLTENGNAHDFNIGGNRWEVALSELQTAKVDRRFKKYDLLNMLYV